MSKAQHTPGPWTYRNIEGGNSCIVEYGDYAIAKIFSWVDHQHDSHEANASLIATAPELLEALEAMTHLARAHMTMEEIGREWMYFRMSRSAIAKAKGE